MIERMNIRTILLCTFLAAFAVEALGDSNTAAPSTAPKTETKKKSTNKKSKKKEKKPEIKKEEPVAKSAVPTVTDAAAANKVLPFRPGEKMEYSITWGVIPAGTATFEVLPFEKINEQNAYHLHLVITTNSFVDLFYKVRDDVNSFTDEQMTRALLFRKLQNEGSYHRDYEIKFDWTTKKIVRTNYGKPDKELTLESLAFDPLSIFYSFRYANLDVGRELSKAVTDGERCIDGKIKIVRKEIIKVPAGEYEAFVIEPDLANIGGVFQQSKNSKLFIWVSTDYRKIPVRIQSEVAVGSFYADLITYKEGVERKIATENKK